MRYRILQNRRYGYYIIQRRFARFWINAFYLDSHFSSRYWTLTCAERALENKIILANFSKFRKVKEISF